MERNSTSYTGRSKEYIQLQNFCQLDTAQSHMVLQWRNHPGVRQWLFNQQPISSSEHQAFLNDLKQDSRRNYWLLSVDGKDLGVLNLHHTPEERVEWGFHLNPNESGRGIDLMYYALQYFFEGRKLARVYGLVDYRNTTALLLHDFFDIESLGHQWKTIGGTRRCFALRAKSAASWDSSLCLNDWKRCLLTHKATMKQQRLAISQYQSYIGSSQH